MFIDGIGVHRYQLPACPFDGLRHLSGAADAEQSRIKADACVIAHRIREPAAGGAGAAVEYFVTACFNLRACLNRVPAVDKQCRPVLKYYCGSRRTSKAGQPRQPFRCSRDELAKELVFMRLYETPEPVFRQPVPDQLQALPVHVV